MNLPTRIPTIAISTVAESLGRPQRMSGTIPNSHPLSFSSATDHYAFVPADRMDLEKSGNNRTLTAHSRVGGLSPHSGLISNSSSHPNSHDGLTVASIGSFLSDTDTGRTVSLGMVVVGLGGSVFAFLLMSRFIFWTGLYKFPYPLVMTWIQLALTHGIIWMFALLTRLCAKFLSRNGLGCIIAPSFTTVLFSSPSYVGSSSSQTTNYLSHFPSISRLLSARISFISQYRRSARRHEPIQKGGIAGGGVFEFNTDIAKQVLPLAIVFLAQTTLSNISFAFAVLPIFLLSRSAIVLFTFVFANLYSGEMFSVATLSSALTATFSLMLAFISPVSRSTWESVTAGVFSSVVTAMFPILLVDVAEKLLRQMQPPTRSPCPSPDPNNSTEDFKFVTNRSIPGYSLISTSAPVSPASYHHVTFTSSNISTNGDELETKVFWVLLHYISLMSIILLTPILFISDELSQLRRNCYFLDVPWFWFLCFLAALAFAFSCVFYLLLLRLGGERSMTTTPTGFIGNVNLKACSWGSNSAGVSANMVLLTVSAAQLLILGGRTSSHRWMGVIFCCASCIWYALSDHESWSVFRKGDVGG